MLDVNLVPDNLRNSRSRKFLPDGFSIPKEAIVGVVGGLIVFLLCIHFVLQGLIAIKFVQHRGYKKQLEKILPEKQMVDGVMAELRSRQNKIKAVDQTLGKKKIMWSQRFQDISDVLTRGVWLTSISLDRDYILIQGSAVAKNKVEKMNVYNFMSNLKKNKEFSTYFVDIELERIKSRQISFTTVDDFTIRAILKE